MSKKASDPFAEYANKDDYWLSYRDRFRLPVGLKAPVQTYLCGHSLGLMPKSARLEVETLLNNWMNLGVRGHFHGPAPWIEYANELERSLATIVGARSEEIAIMNSLTVNIHLLLATFYRPKGKRTKIVMESPCFPSDRYAVTSHLRHRGINPDSNLLLWHPDAKGIFDLNQLESILMKYADSISLLFLGGLNYYNGQMLDLNDIANLAERFGIAVGIDLAHAAGNVQLDLHQWGIDFGVLCTYKYLNGGAGSIGAAFIHEKHHQPKQIRLEGWWGNHRSNRFDMLPDFTPAPGAQAWKLSNPPVVALAPLKASLSIFAEVGIDRISQRSSYLTAYLEERLLRLAPGFFDILTPAREVDRGAMLSLHFKLDSADIYEFLSGQDVVADWRRPDVIRMAPCPLYNSIDDIDHVVSVLSEAKELFSKEE
ncbi:MAG: kynureninase [Saprospiraceae bacterium]|nr:kynureninase [Saprospiraceae bacterium]